MKIIGLHGVHSDGDDTVDVVLQKCHDAGYLVRDVDYHLSILETYDEDKLNKIVDKVEDIFEDGDIIMAHSAGCLLTTMLAERLAKYKDPQTISAAWFFHAALDPHTVFPNTIGTVYNVYDKFDIVLMLADLLPCNRMGSLGQRTYCGPSKNVIDLSFKLEWSLRWLGHDRQLEREVRPELMNLIFQSLKTEEKVQKCLSKASQQKKS